MLRIPEKIKNHTIGFGNGIQEIRCYVNYS